jgi:hypothetical protein
MAAYKEACRIMTAKLVGAFDVGTVICTIDVGDGITAEALSNTDGHRLFAGRTGDRAIPKWCLMEISSLEMGRLPQKEEDLPTAK